MNKGERSAIEEAISLLEDEVRHNEKGFWCGSVFVSQESDTEKALEILKGIIKTKGDKHEREMSKCR